MRRAAIVNRQSPIANTPRGLRPPSTPQLGVFGPPQSKIQNSKSKIRIAIRLGYDGTLFDAYARQPEGRTVEGALLSVLREANALADPPRFASASRTDRGVSAIANCVAFDLRDGFNPANIPPSVNGRARGLWATGYAVVGPDFRPRRALRRRYRYLLPGDAFTPAGWKRAASVAGRFAGTHDFTHFSRRDGDAGTVRTVESVTLRRMRGGEVAALDVVGRSFLWNQVRRMVAALAAVGRGERREGEVAAALRGRPPSRPFGPAPPEPLFLVSVDYPFRFTRSPRADALLRDWCTAMQRLHRIREIFYISALTEQEEGG